MARKKHFPELADGRMIGIGMAAGTVIDQNILAGTALTPARVLKGMLFSIGPYSAARPMVQVHR